MELVIDLRGTCYLIYNETIDLNALGTRILQRASLVEPNSTGQRQANLSPVGGPVLGPFCKEERIFSC